MIPSQAIFPSDDEARARIRGSLDESLIVEAAAGTGKTSELVRRIVNVLESGRTTVDRIAAVTFTHKAAGELKLRLRQGLDQRRTSAPGPEELHNLEDALARLEEATIGTIHSFCAQILRERPVEARVDPAFVEMPETEADRIYDRAFRGWIQEKLNESAPGLRRALIRLAWRDNRDSSPPLDQLKYAGRSLIEWRDHPAAWEHAHFDRENEIRHMVEVVRAASASLNRARANQPVHEFAQWVERAGAGGTDTDTLEALLLKTQREMRFARTQGTAVLREALDKFRRDADADLAWQLREEMNGLVERYEDAKRHAGQLDFLDLLVLARDLVRDNGEVRAYLQKRYTHLFVDEFQDTDPLQAELILLLAADDAGEMDWLRAKPVAGKLFVVGDPKQSIYKFRRADVVLYQSLRERLESCGVGVTYLRRSFRSVPQIQQCVNAAFADEMTGDRVSGQARYVPLEAHAEGADSQPAVVVLPPPEPYGFRNISKAAIEACLPETAGAWIAWLIHESGWTIRDPEGGGERIPISPRHVCLLFRRFTNFGNDMTRDYTRALEARGIPHLLVGSRSFHSREEVETMRAALTAVEWPGDELSLFATLRGSLFAISDATLLKFRHRFGRLHPFQERSEDDSSDYAPVWDALEAMARLHRRRNHRAVVETVNLLLEATRAHAGFALRPGGHQVLANVRRISDLARSYEMEGGISFRGFVEFLENQAKKGDSAEAPVLEEGAEGVRLMTVHAAKGLEFPVVLLADITANIQSTEPQRYVDGAKGICAQRILGCTPWELAQHRGIEADREHAEGVRVAYVAATRARDLLVIPAVGDEERDGWLEPLNKAIYPAWDRRAMADTAPGCPPFGRATVFNRPQELVGDGELSVRPGLHVPRTGEHGVVWWDPSRLGLKVESSFGIRQREILAEDGGSSHAEMEQWRERRETLNRKGSRARFEIFTPSETGSAPEGFRCEIAVERTDRVEGRPIGPRFGTLVHAMLRDVDFKEGLGEVVPLAQLHGRMLGNSEAEIEAAWEAVQAALRHPVMRAAAQAAQCRREWPMLLRSGDQLIEGVIDMAFEADGVWTVVDYKTDDDFDSRQSHYEIQLQWYAHGVTRLTGLPVRGCLLRV
ncbi:MAG: UvrD-helicase domain-containing protein [Bryobacteraceae bacterium]